MNQQDSRVYLRVKVEAYGKENVASLDVDPVRGMGVFVVPLFPVVVVALPVTV